jgi:hypothetical protein
MDTGGLALSVVVACDGMLPALTDRLRAIEQACAGIRAEIIVVHPKEDEIAFPRGDSLSMASVGASSRLVPVLWGAGIAVARGAVVALTTTQFRVSANWATRLLEAFADSSVVGAGGTMALADGASMFTRAVFLVRYSEHMALPSTPAPREIAGDNAAYRRDAVLRVACDVARGFWEVDVHRLMRAEGGRIVRAPAAVAVFAPAFTAAEMLRNRYVHGSHFGAYRVRALGWPRWRAIAVTPLVPAVLLARIVGRLRRAGQSLTAVAVLLPAMVPLLIAWALGEARGACSRHRVEVA